MLKALAQRDTKLLKRADFGKMLKDALKQKTVCIIDVPVDYSENYTLIKKLGQNICPI